MLAEEKYTKQLYAIKVLKKEFIIENDEVERYIFQHSFTSYIESSDVLNNCTFYYFKHEVREACFPSRQPRTPPILAWFTFVFPDGNSYLLRYGIC